MFSLPSRVADSLALAVTPATTPALAWLWLRLWIVVGVGQGEQCMKPKRIAIENGKRGQSILSIAAGCNPAKRCRNGSQRLNAE